MALLSHLPEKSRVHFRLLRLVCPSEGPLPRVELHARGLAWSS